MVNIIFGIIIAAIVGSSSLYIIKAKKRGQKCIGCPASGTASCHCHK